MIKLILKNLRAPAPGQEYGAVQGGPPEPGTAVCTREGLPCRHGPPRHPYTPCLTLPCPAPQESQISLQWEWRPIRWDQVGPGVTRDHSGWPQTRQSECPALSLNGRISSHSGKPQEFLRPQPPTPCESLESLSLVSPTCFPRMCMNLGGWRGRRM